MQIIIPIMLAVFGSGPDIAAVALADKSAEAYRNTTYLEMTAVTSRTWKDGDELHHKIYNVIVVMEGNSLHAVIHGDVLKELTKIPLPTTMRTTEHGRVAEFTFWEEVDGCLIDEFKRPSWLGENEPPWLKGIRQGKFKGKKTTPASGEYFEVVRIIEEQESEGIPYWKRVDTYKVDPKTFFILGVKTQEYNSPESKPYMTAIKIYTVINFKERTNEN